MTFLTVNAAVAETRDEATALMLPNLQMMARLRTGQPLGPLRSRRGRRSARADPAGSSTSSTADCARAVVGSPDRGRRTDALRWPSEFGVDEVMVHPVASAHRGTDPATAPARETTLELLAKELF